jgi:hypothetical protein
VPLTGATSESSASGAERGLIRRAEWRRASHGRAVNDGWYDLVVGPVVASWKQRLVFAESDQISFHTVRAVQLLAAGASQVI